MAVDLGWPLQDIMAAKVMVKRLVGAGYRKGPPDMMILPAHVVEDWFTEDAVRYLKEQKAARSKPVAEI